jgi:hypothetical protein
LTAWHKVGVHVLGSTQPIDLSLEKIKERLGAPLVAQDIYEWDSIPIDYFEKLAPLQLSGYQGLINTDDHPFLEFNLLRYLNSGTKKSSGLMPW